MRFRQIKSDGKKVALSWVTKDSAGTETAHSMESSESPAPEFTQALAAFVPLVLDLLELPKKYSEDLTVTGLSISESADSRGLVVMATKKVARANGPFNIATPHLKAKQEEGQADGKGLISDAMQEALADAEKAADAFRTGARSQTELPLDEKPVRPSAEGISEIRKSVEREPAGV